MWIIIQDLREQYTLLQTQLQEIDSVAADHQRGLSKDNTVFKALQKVRKNCTQVLREIKRVMSDEECGFTVNRLDEYFHAESDEVDSKQLLTCSPFNCKIRSMHVIMYEQRVMVRDS